MPAAVVRQMIHGSDELNRLDRLCDMHMKTGGERALTLVLSRMSGNGRCWNPGELRPR